MAPAVLLCAGLFLLSGGAVAGGSVVPGPAAGGPMAVGLVGPVIPAGLIAWAVTVYLLSSALWAWFTHRMGAPFWYGALYPLGAAVGSFIFLRAWVRGRTVEWKGRRYRLRPVAERA